MRSFRLCFKYWSAEFFAPSCSQTFSWVPRGHKFKWSPCSFVLYVCRFQITHRFQQEILVGCCNSHSIFSIRPLKCPIFWHCFRPGFKFSNVSAYLLRLLWSPLASRCAYLSISYWLHSSSRCRSIGFFSIFQLLSSNSILFINLHNKLSRRLKTIKFIKHSLSLITEGIGSKNVKKHLNTILLIWFYFIKLLMSTAERKAVIKHADMNEEMQQDAIDCANVALEKFNI